MNEPMDGPRSGGAARDAKDSPVFLSVERPRRSAWKVLALILLALFLVAGGFAAYLFWVQLPAQAERGTALEQAQKDLAQSNLKLAMQLEALIRHQGEELARLEQAKQEEIRRIKGTAEEEILRMKGTEDEMQKTLRGEIEKGQVQITKLADRLSVNIVDKILFPSGQAEISEEGQAVLKRVGEVLVQAKDKVIRIEGHTDNIPVGSAIRERFPTNWELSTARASNVVRFLQESAGVDPAALEAVGMSEFQPIADNRNPATRARNRRIEIVLFPRVKALAKELPAGPAPEKIP
jgi:chemotaxis protein MotB